MILFLFSMRVSVFVCECLCLSVFVLIVSYISYSNCQQCQAATAERRVAYSWDWPTTQLTPAPAILAALRAVGSLFINARWRRSRRGVRAVGENCITLHLALVVRLVLARSVARSLTRSRLSSAGLDVHIRVAVECMRAALPRCCCYS